MGVFSILTVIRIIFISFAFITVWMIEMHVNRYNIGIDDRKKASIIQLAKSFEQFKKAKWISTKKFIWHWNWNDFQKYNFTFLIISNTHKYVLIERNMFRWMITIYDIYYLLVRCFIVVRKKLQWINMQWIHNIDARDGGEGR